MKGAAKQPRDKESRPAVFLDRDGTLVEDRGILRHPSDLHFFPDTVPALRRLQADHDLFVVTHQPAIASGDLSPAEAAGVNDALVRRLAEAGVRIRALYCCPHRREDGCQCIKPHPFFLFEARRTFGIDLRRSFTVGDHPHDVALAAGVGATGLYLRTGHGEKHRKTLPAGAVVLPGIREAADWILAWRVFEETDGVSLLDRAARKLRAGGVAAFPTETVYGLGACAFNASAVARIFEIKRRPRFDPLIVHIADLDDLSVLTREVPGRAARLIDRFWPGPLTLVLPRSSAVPDLVTAGLPTVAIRMPRHPVALELVRRTGTPLAAPSANPFGRTSPTRAEHVRQQLGGAVDEVLDAGPCPVGIESTIVAVESDRLVLLRPGGVPVEEIEPLAGPVTWARRGAARPRAPGRLDRHYTTSTPFFVRPEGQGARKKGRVGLLAFAAPGDISAYSAVEVLSDSGDLCEAAANLFAAMRRLDGLGLDGIEAELAPEEGLGLAINDRLRRAACGTDRY